MRNITFDFTGRAVVVTGAARGVGLAVGTYFRQAGATVYLVDLEAGPVQEAADEIGAIGLAADVTDTGQVTEVIERVVAESGRIDVLVNNAGNLRDGVVWKLSDDDYESVMAVHAGGTFRFTRAVVPHFRRQGAGRIINVTSYTGLRGNPGQSNYSMAKAGIIGFTRTTAKELARFGITVNAISPSAQTRMIASVPQEKLAQLTAAIPMGRFADASEMAAAVAFLASDEASYITGVVLPVDGGMAI
ncbi:SDR family NAD(P)-dependent oxidoreductase [Micromonospora lutea]|uniref:3-oxoacyl-[acyl-carrier-protein] reductase FabG n=1 Tax=Micromonospora lutea TaxID=419825 RepID=A0ABQ4J209_9ACTN|nr:SDR family oxidoreductase [Micromonospora lutea]GIJ24196.1 3-oxoacyl-[acyl-carrier-protein] reductase FabG [Micromonospora lutea]